jgi:hypothetical protein
MTEILSCIRAPASPSSAKLEDRIIAALMLARLQRSSSVSAILSHPCDQRHRSIGRTMFNILSRKCCGCLALIPGTTPHWVGPVRIPRRGMRAGPARKFVLDQSDVMPWEEEMAKHIQKSRTQKLTQRSPRHTVLTKEGLATHHRSMPKSRHGHPFAPDKNPPGFHTILDADRNQPWRDSSS